MTIYTLCGREQMNLKKMIAVSAMLLLGSGFSFATNWTCAKVKQKLIENQPLPVDVINADLTDCKQKLGKLAQDNLTKKGFDKYVAYANAAIIYAAEDEWSDWHVLTETSFANVRKYAAKAIALEGSRRSPNMHYVRAITVERFLNLDMASNQGDRCFKDSVKSSVNEVKAMLADFEEVGVRQPNMAPWASMADYYEALYKVLGGEENLKKARSCRAKARTYAEQKQERDTNEVLGAFKKLFS